jgi:hypothetical protein
MRGDFHSLAVEGIAYFLKLVSGMGTILENDDIDSSDDVV